MAEKRLQFYTQTFQQVDPATARSWPILAQPLLYLATTDQMTVFI